MKLQSYRVLTRVSFFLLFLTAPVLDIFRLDLSLGNFIIFGQQWTLGLQEVQSGQGEVIDGAIQVFFHVFLPVLSFIGISGFLIWKYGRIYCGWLCPHFSVVEMINQTMLKHLHRVTLWEKASKKAQGLISWMVVLAASISMAFVWAVTLLQYLLPPTEVFAGLVNFDLSWKPALFIFVSASIFTIDFMLFRHLFCKYGCALGVFQSLIWMANPKAMVVKFDKTRAESCRGCNNQCDQACPMRLPVRSIKRAKFTCTQCAQCLSACDRVQKDNTRGSLLIWVSGTEAKEVDRSAPVLWDRKP